MNENPFNITRDEILNLAAQKVADEFSDMESIGDTVRKTISERVDSAVKSNLLNKVDTFLSSEMDKIMRTEVTPLNIWGEKTGAKPTTIRDMLSERARVFWDEKVDSEGKVGTSSWNTKPRHEYMFAKIVNEEFAAVVKQNMVNLIGAFKDAVRADAQKQCDAYLNELIRVKSNGDKK